jgi:hypothetical protein
MTRDRKIHWALLATGGALVVYGGVSTVAAATEGRKRPTAALPAKLAGWALMFVGAHHLSPNAAYAGLGALISVEAYHYFKTNALDPATADAMRAALSKEKDPAILHEFASKLRDAGHTRAADVVEKRAVEITPAARVGQDVSSISEAQARLRDLGYSSVPQDGRLGAETVLALKRFQSLYDLDIDGQVTPETLAALRRATTH